MTRLLVLAFSALFLAGCELGYDPGFGPEQEPRISVLVKDAKAALADGSGEALFEIVYCANSSGEAYLVSELRADLDAQGMNWHSGWSLRYALTYDANRDHRFGPGDVLTVSEKDWSDFGPDDSGTTYGVSLYRVPDLGMDELLAKADWQAR